MFVLVCLAACDNVMSNYRAMIDRLPVSFNWRLSCKSFGVFGDAEQMIAQHAIR